MTTTETDQLRDAMRTVVGALLAAEDGRDEDRARVVEEFDGDVEVIATAAIGLLRYTAECIARTSDKSYRQVLQLLAYDVVSMKLKVRSRDE